MRAHRIKLAVLILLLLALAGYHGRALWTPYLDQYVVQSINRYSQHYYRGQVAYNPTGDELFDTYAVALTALYHQAKSPFTDKARKRRRSPILVKLANPTFDIDIEGLGGQLDSDALFANLAEYENTPEYWELKYMVDYNRADLQEAIDRGLATTAMLDLFDFDRMMTNDPQRALQISELGIELDPSNSYYYYQKANQLILLGDTEQALQSLRAGNSAPNNEWPRPYTMRMFEKHLQDAADPDTQVIAYATWVRSPLPMLLYYRDNSERVVDALKAGAGPALMNEWLRFTERFAKMEGQSLISVHVAVAAEETALKLLLKTDLPTESDRKQIAEEFAIIERFREFISKEILGADVESLPTVEQKFERCLHVHKTISTAQKLCEHMGIQLEISGAVPTTK